MVRFVRNVVRAFDECIVPPVKPSMNTDPSRPLVGPSPAKKSTDLMWPWSTAVVSTQLWSKSKTAQAMSILGGVVVHDTGENQNGLFRQAHLT
jgi:hypothetical protein